LGDKSGGINQLTYLLKETPNSPMADNALFKYAKIQIEQGNGEEGIASLVRLIDSYEGSELVDDASYLIARTYLDNRQYDQAITELNSFITSYPDSLYMPRAHFDLGMAYRGLGKYGYALSIFENVIIEFPTSGIADDAYYQSGYCKFNESDYKGALAIFESFGGIYPDSPLMDEARFQGEMCRYKLGDYRNEVEMAEAYVNRYPDSRLCSGLYIDIAQYYGKTGANKKTEIYYLLAEETADSSDIRYEARKRLADHYTNTGQRHNAISVLGRIADDAGSADRETALYRMAELSEDIGDDAGALTYYSRIINEFPGGKYHGSSLLKSGNGLRKLKLYDESNATLSQFIIEYPDSKKVNVARFYIAFNYQRMGNYEEAIKYHKSVAANGRRSLAVQSYYWLGICERDMGNTTEARSYFTKIINNYRDYPDWVDKAEKELDSF